MLANAADDHITSRAFLEDAGGNLSIEQVSVAQFAPAGAILAKGYTDSVHWVRLVVRAPSHGGNLVLRVRPNFLDEVTLFSADPAQSSGWQTHTTGDRTAFLERELGSMSLGFEVTPSAPQSVYYLRLKTSSASILNVQALEPRQASLKDTRLALFQTLYLGLMLLPLFWAISDYVVSRQRVVAWFILNQAVHFFYNFSIMGSLAPLFPADSRGLLDQLTTFSVSLTTLCGAIFYRSLLSTFEPPRVALRALDALIVGTGVNLVLMAAGHSRLALNLNAWVVILIGVVTLVLAFSARKDAPPGRGFLHVMFGIQSAAMLIVQLSFVGWVQATEWTLNVMFLFGFIAAWLMFLLLYARSRQLLRVGEQAVFKLELTRQQLENEQHHRETQKRFTSMLSHELKTPLSVVRLTLDAMRAEGPRRRRMDRAIGDMGAIIERCVQVDQLEQGELPSHMDLCDVAALIKTVAAASTEVERIHIAPSLPLPALNTDPQLLAVVLANLFDNALKYSVPGAPVEVEAELAKADDRPGIRLTVSNPIGAAGPLDASVVFKKYYRAPGAQGKSGSGLGLYLVQGIVKDLKGHINYTGTDEKASFQLWLPL